MMQLVKCKNCGNSKIEFGQTSIEVKRTKIIKCCESCDNTKEEIKIDFFCTEDCYEDYLRDCMEHGDF